MEEQMQRKAGVMPEMELLLKEAGMTEQQAVKLLRGALKQQMQMMQRARQVLSAMEALEDARFTPETLRANPEAMKAMEEGASVGEVYRKYFLGERMERTQETEANLGLGGWMDGSLTPDQIARISDYVSKTGQTYEMD